MTTSDPVELKRWDYAGGASGPVPREIKKSGISPDALGRLELAMKRIEDGTSRAQETDLVRKGVYELRVDADKRWYRLLWGRCGDRFVALTFVVKKSNKLRPADVDRAIKRLSEHCSTE